MTLHPTPASQASYTDTLFLPNTAFAMRHLPAQDKDLLTALGPNNGYTPPSKPTFTLHDGPPYANGDLHPGHFLNKVLKDVTARAAAMRGHHVAFQPGWDCHGLPVEWAVEKAWQAAGKDKQADTLAFRRACRAYADGWVNTQRATFQTFGVAADWSNPYKTMNAAYETGVAQAFLTMRANGLVYAAKRPMLWSSVEHTVLAEAELEYHNRKLPTAWVLYPVASGPLPATAYLLAWTSMPWTLTVSAGLAYGALSYGLYTVETSTGWLPVGTQLVLADSEHATTQDALRVTLTRSADVSAATLEKTRVAHPLAKADPFWDTTLPCVPGPFVTAGSGSGLVHLAPAHGPEDYALSQTYAQSQTTPLSVTDALTAENTLVPMPLFGGLPVFTQTNNPASEAVVETLKAHGHLAGLKTQTTSYPHSWRSRAPVVYRMTPQWFLSLDTPTNTGVSLRARALAALEEVVFTPTSAKARLTAMVRTRPDWVLSRQRAWGVPLPLFYDTSKTPDDPTYVLDDPTVYARVLDAFATEGADAWYKPDAKQRFLGGLVDPDRYTQCMDVLDVWFESGCSHHLLLDGPADVYMEGTDQHRGWFQASLVCAMALGNPTPFTHLVTHGFTLDGKGQKMSKSLGNTQDPQALAQTHGLDVMRLWVAMSDTTQDTRLSPQSLASAKDVYRKLRNTVRFLLGALHDDAFAPNARQFSGPKTDSHPSKHPNGHQHPTDTQSQHPQDQTAQQSLHKHQNPMAERHQDPTPGQRQHPTQEGQVTLVDNTPCQDTHQDRGDTTSQPGRQPSPMPDTGTEWLEAWLLGTMAQTNTAVLHALETHQVSKATSLVHQFCTGPLSALYCDKRKDSLYCDPQGDPRRQAALATLSLALDTLVSWLMPLTPLLAQEALLHRYQGPVTPHTLDLSAYAPAPHQEEAHLLRKQLHALLENTEPKPPTSALHLQVRGSHLDADTLHQWLGVGRLHTSPGPLALSLVTTFDNRCPRCWTGQETDALCARCTHATITQG